ncbi:MAG: D-glycero-beta-D-manno-heptose 1-phosphate adenylyltransferase [Bacteroidota bacterium]|nr:D-glycero-beta-D-manno-heptose 1-phosphate adenylyltransferase [Bacteroidota bacterium]MDP4230075.1 D-glycero-beta-D-manno-heptose 1-phosphate adenylyltransferase [Bacteroidota bacterium]MDP4235740.1 D-glycero-beta-D-manno-heptose 1-phosphate adenylyltransferase [Bacteroidota bacterium]
MSQQITFAPIFTFRHAHEQEQLRAWRKALRDEHKNLVFTNGVFDILHHGHVSYLKEARNLGDALVIGCNADASVRRLKGEKRPLQSEGDRAHILAALKATDCVVIFDDDTPLSLVEFLVPDVLVKGADWSVEHVVGRDVVERHGGKVLTIPFIEGRSTTGVVEKVIERYSK